MIDDMAKAATPSDIWKAPVTAAEEFDRTMALRIAAVAHVPITVTSLEEYWAQWDDPAIEENVDNAPKTLVDEHGALVEGTSHLRLSDGTRWVAADALIDTHMHGDGPGDNLFLQRLYVLLLEHQMLRSCRMGPSLPSILLQADTLDVRRVFCTEPGCRAWCDLQVDAEEADETLGPWDAS